ncbi:PIG-L deacetylase family protein [Pandoraea sputorum]|uniref:PIG-L deacetylase family protein n=1 Tax=Pandoraea sputorum TaxID=93222 RepID=UPI001241865A|nr:PIG-L family deacetylase [Pandoraea sputorum]VVE85334.1 N-acetyl-alpha-D-glucosaminyl L-malate deacetylase 1 [Pandoraea sputorum]
MDTLSARVIAGEGPAEATWQHWFRRHPLPTVPARSLVAPGHAVHVVAPHPDDEVLGCGGTLHQWARCNVEVHLWAVTDGEASHPGSTVWTPAQLAEVRVRESLTAQQRLSLRAGRHRLRIPDGQVAAHESRIADALCRALMPGDTVLAPWRFDAHPDHEAVARACLRAAQAIRCHVIEMPIWGWHWADPASDDLPLERAVAVRLPRRDRLAKRQAMSAFRSQLGPDPSTGAPPVLPTYALARWQRPFEVFFL